MIGGLTLALVGGFVALALKPVWSFWFTFPNGHMYGQSIARAYAETNEGLGEGDGGCERTDGDSRWDCWIETDPGSGPGAGLVLWTTDGHCWKARFEASRKDGERIELPDSDPLESVWVTGPELAGCVELPKDLW